MSGYLPSGQNGGGSICTRQSLRTPSTPGILEAVSPISAVTSPLEIGKTDGELGGAWS